jgi:hypothetical protein
MKRMQHPGKPPSQRRPPGWSEDWRERLRATTSDLAIKLREIFEFDDPTVRQHIIDAVRIAIGEGSHPDPQSVADSETGDGSASILATTASTYREALRRCGIDRSDSVAAESFMAEVVKALDDDLGLGLGWRTKVGNATRIMVATLLKTRHGDIPTIRRELLAAAREALGDRPLEEMVKMVEAPASPSGPAGTVPALSKAGMYRMILDCEEHARRDMTPESFLAAVVASLDECLA